ncbi:MAG: STAS domain-containing protein, partial [Polyangiaceae bacterium]
LTRVKFVSSAGLRLLLIVYRKLKDESRTLILVGVSDDIARVMSHTGFLSYFTLVNTEADAFSALAQK